MQQISEAFHALNRALSWRPGGLRRPLTESERRLLPSALARDVELSDVRIVDRFHNPLAAALNMTVARKDAIFWSRAPHGARSLGERAHLAHELVHVWQYRRLGLGGFRILLDRRYRYRLSPERSFASYGAEQQAAIVEDFVLLAAGQAPRFAHAPIASAADYARVIETVGEPGRSTDV